MTKKIILYTEEGKAKRQNETCWKVFSDFSLKECAILQENEPENVLYFDCEANAKAYVDLYKPQFSKAFIYDIFKKLKKDIYFHADSKNKIMDKIKKQESAIYNYKRGGGEKEAAPSGQKNN